MILNSDWALPREIKVGETVVTEDTTCVEDNNDMTFAFNNDLGSGTTSGGENDSACENITCPDGSTCSNGMCLCPNGKEICGTTCCESNNMCSNEICVSVVGDCVTNTDCNNGSETGAYYCAITATRDKYEATCYKDYVGTCTPVGGDSSTTITGLGTVYKSSDKMTWLGAKNWCKAKDMRLLDISNNRLGCYKSDGITPFESMTTGYCCADGQPDCSTTLSKQSAIMQALRNTRWNVWVWTATSHTDYCFALNLPLTTGAVGTHYLATGVDSNGYALCEDK